MSTFSNLLLSMVFLFFNSFAGGIQLIISNQCNETIWPGILGGDGQTTPENGGFILFSCGEAIVNLPEHWTGRIWGRRGCCFDSDGKGSCDTGDCAGYLHCRGIGGTPPATVIQMSFGTSKSTIHYYDVSLVDGFNLPVTMFPVGSVRGQCGVAGCESDLNSGCPMRFAVRKEKKVVGCQSACLALKAEKYCCSGKFSHRDNCKPTLFSKIFKAICPRAYSFPYDKTGLNTCSASQYKIVFCPSTIPTTT